MQFTEAELRQRHHQLMREVQEVHSEVGKKELALVTIADLAQDFLKRKDDEELSSEDVQALITEGDLTPEEAGEAFSRAIRAELGLPPGSSK